MTLAQRWNRYWFADAPYFDLALMRIVVVGFQVFFLLDSHYSSLQYVMTLPHDMFRADPRIIRFLVRPWGIHAFPGPDIVFAIFWITFLAGVGSLLGALTTISTIIFALGSLLIQAFLFSFTDYHHPEAIAIIGTLALALSPCGKVFSVDSWLRRQRMPSSSNSVALLDYSGPYAGWPILFIQWFFPLMYISAAVAKLAFANYTLDWANGFTLQYYFIQDDIRKFAPLAVWASQFHWPILIGQVVVLFYQLTYFLVVPFKKLRWIYLPLGLTFHMANYLIIKAPFPQWIIFLLLAYIPWSTALKMAVSAKVPVDSAPRSPVTTDSSASA